MKGACLKTLLYGVMLFVRVWTGISYICNVSQKSFTPEVEPFSIVWAPSNVSPIPLLLNC